MSVYVFVVAMPSTPKVGILKAERAVRCRLVRYDDQKGPDKFQICDHVHPAL